MFVVDVLGFLGAYFGVFSAYFTLFKCITIRSLIISMLTTSTWHYLFGVVLLQEGIDVVLGVLEVACGVEGGVGEEEKSPSRHPEQRCELRSDELTITYLSTETVISYNCLCFENFCPQNLKDMKKLTRQMFFLFTFATRQAYVHNRLKEYR